MIDLMHVVMIPSWYPETAEDFSGSFFREQAAALINEGHHVGVLAVRGYPVYEAKQFLAERHGPTAATEERVEVLRTNVLLPVPKLHRVNLKVLERAWMKQYREYVREHGTPDVLHAHSMFPGGIIAHRLSQQVGVPFVVTEHRPSSIDRLREPGLGGAMRGAAQAAGALVAVARGFVPELNEAYGVRRWQYLPGLLSPQLEAAQLVTRPEGPFTFLHVSHLDPGKDVAGLIRAFDNAFRDDDGVRLRIVGGSEHLQALQALATSLELETVTFTGAVARDRIAQEFASAHAFALTSEAEAFGTVLWEAMALGLPILSTDTWAGNNAVRPETGVLVERKNHESIAQGLAAVRERYSSYDAELIRRLCLEHCGQRAFVENYVTVYEGASA